MLPTQTRHANDEAILAVAPKAQKHKSTKAPTGAFVPDRFRPAYSNDEAFFQAANAPALSPRSSANAASERHVRRSSVTSFRLWLA